MATKPTKTNKPTVKKSEQKINYIWAVGRRKRAIARVRLYPKKGKDKNIDITVNGKPISQYFNNPFAQLIYDIPLKLTNSINRFKITAKISGSGLESQLDALLHGLSRGLVKANEEFKPVLRQNGYLTRDPRKKQRRMIGRGGKARAQKQSPKR